MKSRKKTIKLLERAPQNNFLYVFMARKLRVVIWQKQIGMIGKNELFI